MKSSFIFSIKQFIKFEGEELKEMEIEEGASDSQQTSAAGEDENDEMELAEVVFLVDLDQN